MMALDIAEGQQWHTRGGAIIRISKDRQEFAVIPRWRWSLSNGHMCDDDGLVNDNRRPHHSDLTHRVGTLPVSLPDAAIRGMDSTMGGL